MGSHDERLDLAIKGSLEGRSLAWSNGSGHGRLTLASDLQGFPETGHGGGVAALFWELARPLIPPERAYPIRVALLIQRNVDVGVPLGITAQRPRGQPQFEATIAKGERLLAQARVQWGPEVTVGGPGEEPLMASATSSDSWEIPGNAMCLACGSRNPVGLRIRFRYTDEAAGRLYRPRPPHQWERGEIYPGCFFVGLDELAWWLGALRMGEAGVTTDIGITLLAPHPFGEPILFAGTRSQVASVDPRHRIWRVQAWALAKSGRPLAHANVLFAGSRAYTKRLVQSLLEGSTRESIRRIFPGAVGG